MKTAAHTEHMSTEQVIVDAAIGVFLRFGAKKTTMADIAHAAGVSRQTVYATFGDKDGVIVACIRRISTQSEAAIRARLSECETLGEKLRAYYDETVVKSFEMLQTAGDPEDLISGHNAAGRVAIQEAHAQQATLVRDILAEYDDALKRHGQTPEGLAHFVVTVSMGLKYGPTTRADLDGLLTSLTESVKALTSAA